MQCERLLLVDDEPITLNLLSSQLKDRFNVQTALSGIQAVELLKRRGPFSIAVSDLAMPGMDGITFLRHVKEQSPETVRLMMTVGSEFEDVVQSINESEVYRFIPKPVHPDFMNSVLEKAIKKYHFDAAEKSILSRTVRGAIQSLSELLAARFGEDDPILRAADLAVEIGIQLDYPNISEVRLAAQFAHLGYLMLPNGKVDSRDRQAIIDANPALGAKLLSNIPGLEKIASIVARQRDSYSLDDLSPNAMCAYILRVALDFIQLTSDGYAETDAIQKLDESRNQYCPAVLESLKAINAEASVAINRFPLRLKATDEYPTERLAWLAAD